MYLYVCVSVSVFVFLGALSFVLCLVLLCCAVFSANEEANNICCNAFRIAVSIAIVAAASAYAVVVITTCCYYTVRKRTLTNKKIVR